MTLPASGAISLNDVNVELTLTATAQIGLNDAAVRGLFGVASGAISMSDGYGKDANRPLSFAQTDADPPSSTTGVGSSGARYWMTYGFENLGPAFTFTGFEVETIAGGTIVCNQVFIMDIMVGASSATITSQSTQSLGTAATNLTYVDARNTVNVLVPAGHLLILWSRGDGTTQPINHYSATANNTSLTQNVAASENGSFILQRKVSLCNLNYNSSGLPSNPLTHSYVPTSGQTQEAAQWKYKLYGKAVY
jgi:hypothetical protein